jgi:hypothetical protein
MSIQRVLARDKFLLDEPEVAELCGTSRGTVRDWKDRGLIVPVELPRNRDGSAKRRVLFRRDDILAFVESLPSMVGER